MRKSEQLRTHRETANREVTRRMKAERFASRPKSPLRYLPLQRVLQQDGTGRTRTDDRIVRADAGADVAMAVVVDVVADFHHVASLQELHVSVFEQHVLAATTMIIATLLSALE